MGHLSFLRTRLSLLCAASFLVACGGGASEKAPASQVAAKVNGEEITVHELNFALQRRPGVTQENVKEASKQTLEMLIAQAIAVQRAKELKLDRTPAVQQALLAAEREVLARAYTESLASKLAKPSDGEIKAFFDKNPSLFEQRRVYTVAEFSINHAAEQQASVKALVQSATGADDLANKLSSQGLNFGSTLATRPAESIPMNLLPEFAAAHTGQTLIKPKPEGGTQVLLLTQIREAPVTLEKARPIIQRILSNERASKAIQTEMTAARQGAKVEFVGQFAATPAASAPTSNAAPVAPAPASSLPLGLDPSKAAGALR